MQIDLSDKLAIVSGSTAGIGFAIATGLAAPRATVEPQPAMKKAAHARHAPPGCRRHAGIRA
jgi:NAD(P)-dependent dehydrogenase (short-subunit alcohol dehydrogenase family)